MNPEWLTDEELARKIQQLSEQRPFGRPWVCLNGEERDLVDEAKRRIGMA